MGDAKNKRDLIAVRALIDSLERLTGRLMSPNNSVNQAAALPKERQEIIFLHLRIINICGICAAFPRLSCRKRNIPNHSFETGQEEVKTVDLSLLLLTQYTSSSV
ncbi:hypothetical protein HNY73_020185 [Argiope bruennichi]|uniref:Uncharacterized protein n=1 Tax=Argiope bruennichi TaxID=94029 RepID=A0A8T0E729_ARGBR|nr:hypothetical protein HNY73_020185 [Argiope bruennichi]